jgi:predicted RND superfamily exporter protein
MLKKLCLFLLRNKLAFVLLIIATTLFMAWFASKNLRLTYQISRLLPEEHPSNVQYEAFKEAFGQEGNIILVAIPRDSLFHQAKYFVAFEALRKSIDSLRVYKDSLTSDGIQKIALHPVKVVVGETHLPKLTSKDEKFVFAWFDNQNLDSLKKDIENYPFYKGLIYSDTLRNGQKEAYSTVWIYLDAKILNSPLRRGVVEQIYEQVQTFSKQHIALKASGLALMRVELNNRVKEELQKFIVLALLAMIVVLLFFFRDYRILFLCLLLVVLSVVFGLGIIALLDCEITGIMSLLPPLLIVIGVPNAIYFVHSFYKYYERTRERRAAVLETFAKMASVQLITNITTALGFAVFAFTRNQTLTEFGLVAAISIATLFILSLIILPIALDWLRPPTLLETNERIRLNWLPLLQGINHIVQTKRKWVYAGVFLLALLSIYGANRIKLSGNFSDDLPENDKLKQDLRFFEENFSGVMPFEVVITHQDPKKLKKLAFTKVLQEVQDTLQAYSFVSKSLSIADITKYARQAFYEGDKHKYGLFLNEEQSFLEDYLKNSQSDAPKLQNKFFYSKDGTQSRINLQVKDMGVVQMETFIASLKPKLDKIINGKGYDYYLTGSTLVLLEGTRYLIENLIASLLLAIALIAGLMGLLFGSWRMMFLAVLPNLVPLLFTAGIMGFFDVPLKPSTVLVFSIAFGIAMDDSLHYLAKFKQNLRYETTHLAVQNALMDTGKSMIQTSFILFFGFIVFISSDFGSTVALGLLVSLTLLAAMFSNLLVLPSLLMDFVVKKEKNKNI